MRRALLAIAVGFSSGPALVQAIHALAHERGVAHVHHHDDDGAGHRGHDADHHDIVSRVVPTLLNAPPRLDVRVAVAVASEPAMLMTAQTLKSSIRDLGPPERPPSVLLCAVPSNRAPPV